MAEPLWLFGNLETVYIIYSDLILHPSNALAMLQGYMLLGLISSLVFRAVRNALPHDPVSQECILGASFTALAIADVRITVY